MPPSRVSDWLCRLVFWSGLGAAMYMHTYLPLGDTGREFAGPAYWSLIMVTMLFSLLILGFRMFHVLKTSKQRFQVGLRETALVMIGIGFFSWLRFRQLQETVILPMELKDAAIGMPAVLPCMALGAGVWIGLGLAALHGESGSTRWWWALSWVAGRLMLILFGGAVAAFIFSYTVEMFGFASSISPWFLLFLMMMPIEWGRWVLGLWVLFGILFLVSRPYTGKSPVNGDS